MADFVSELRSSRSYDDPSPPPVFEPSRSGEVHLPSPRDLAIQPTEQIRETLAAVAADILIDDSPSDEAIKTYMDFTHQYRRAVANSFVIEDPPDNVFFGHNVEAAIASGAFGQVYRASDEDGTRVAIKVLRQEVIRNDDMLRSFRRGVRSMRILRQRNVEGMVAYREAYELPPCTIMDFVPGLNLEQARARPGYLDHWRDPVKISLDVALIVRSAHKLPERVLHRDIRPANVMLRWREDDPFDWDVVVLDFDLSWHKGASGKSINIDFGEQLGYLAPEQLDRSAKFSTRSANVDSYGLGMTLFFLLTGKHPASKASVLREDWGGEIINNIRIPDDAVWRSNKARIARLVSTATQPEQNARPDMNQIVFELERIKESIDEPSNVETAEFWAEEILARGFYEQKYEWDVDKLEGTVSMMRGVVIKARALEAEGSVQVEAIRNPTGEAHWSGIEKFIERAKEKSMSVLSRGGWHVQHARIGTGKVMVFVATISIEELRVRADAAVAGVRDAAGALNFQ